MAGRSDRIHDRTRLVRRIDHRHHDTVGAGIQIADQDGTFMGMRSHDGRAARATNGLTGDPNIFETPGPVFTVDKNAVSPKLHQPNRETRRNMVRIEHGDAVAGLTACAQFRAIHRLLPSTRCCG